MAASAGDFLLNELNITQYGDELCFSYTPLDHGRVHNANLLGAAFLARLYSETHETRFVEPALKAVRFSVARQKEDGSWMYGEDKTQQWIDNFHTGYNLVALKRFSEYTGSHDFDQSIKNSFQFYLDHFFAEQGIAKYYHDRTYPIDIHAIAYALVTLSEFKDLDQRALRFAKNVYLWSLKNMQNPEGSFSFQKKPYFTNRIQYMRWSQAWMLHALAVYLEKA